jgi:thioesterase domain-containing protein
MVRQLLLPLLGLALLTAETAAAQTQPAAAASPASAAKTARTTPRAGRTLTARERKQAEAAAKAAAAKSPVVAMATPEKDSWSGWSNDPTNLPDDGTLYRPHANVSSAPGMPLNQVSHGVTTDYHGRPIQRATTASSGTTLATPR